MVPDSCRSLSLGDSLFQKSIAIDPCLDRMYHNLSSIDAYLVLIFRDQEARMERGVKECLERGKRGPQEDRTEGFHPRG